MRTSCLLVVFLAVATLLTSACASRHVHEGVGGKKDEAAVVPDAVEAEIAAFVSQAPEGAQATFTQTRYGLATVTVGRSYHSALDIPCREITIQGSQRSRAAVCKDGQRGWILAPDILGDGAL